MKPQFITTEDGKELVVIPREVYDALAALREEDDAEAAGADRLANHYLEEKAAGDGATIPLWFVKLVAEYGSAVTAARKHHGCTQVELAHMLDISQGYLSDIERGRRPLTAEQRHQIAGHTGVEADWLA